MTVLVTGGAGYVGSHLLLALADAGRRAVAIDDLSTGTPEAVPAGVPLVEGCVGDEELLGKVIADHDVDAVVHLAGSIVVPESVTDPLAYYLNNTTRSRSLLAAAVKGGVRRIVFSSTAAVFGQSDTGLVDEGARLDPASPYGASKLMTERMLADASAAYGLRHVVLRYFNVAGADPAGRSGQSSATATHLIKLACQAATGRRDRLFLYGDDYPTADGTCVRDYIHVADLAEAHLLALDHLANGGADLTVNCGYGRGVSVREVIDAVKRISGFDFPVERAPRRAGDAAALVAIPDKAHSVLGWRPRHDDLDAIIRDALAWERALAARDAAA